MNKILEEKLQALENAKDYECWYLVKQPTAFDSLCYLVSFLKEYKGVTVSQNLQDFVETKVNAINTAKPNVNISNNYRALRVAAFFGLITMTSSKYPDAIITDTFEEVTRRCKGEYERTDLYKDIIERQIEKMFLSSEIDEEYQGVREDYRLYPVMLLYKVLIEMGRATGQYKISMPEYRYLVATTKKFEDFLETLLLIKLLRESEPETVTKFDAYKSKFDNRLIQALKQLDTLLIDNDSISLEPSKIEEVAHKVYLFEQNPNVFATNNYLGFLASTKSLFELDEFEADVQEELDESQRLDCGCNVLLYGVPGSGKSWTIEHEYCKEGTRVERLVFHPDYTYSDFIGQILPNVAENGQVSYKFTAGPFTNILKDAYKNPTTEFVLIIEEINRGNAPAIFGEVFQLLDRKAEKNEKNDDGYQVGTSEYGITNANIARIVYGNPDHPVRIPSNMSIIGTMNTSDQNVFTLDTAFQRRWDMRLIENSFEEVEPSFADAYILDTEVTWQNFCDEINKIIIGNNARMTSSEDKRLGAYFVHHRDLVYDKRAEEHYDKEFDDLKNREKYEKLSDVDAMRLREIRDARKQNRKFPEKVIKYLWDDAFKYNREVIFEIATYPSLESVIRYFINASGNERFKVFKDNVVEAFSSTNN